MPQSVDPRHIRTGLEIPSERYCDQPYVVQTDDGAWLCVITTGAGEEGQSGQYVVTRRSTDRGRTWSDPVDVEPADGPEASYAVLLKAPGGRVYCFYNYNADNLRAVKADDPPFAGGLCTRVDSLGEFVFKVSDDHGRTWSHRRHTIPVREMSIDRENAYNGRVRFFWNVGKPFIHGGAAYVPLHKVGGFGHGFFTRSEGVLLRSASLLGNRDPGQVEWETLPDGDAGLRAPRGGGPIAEEHSTVVLSDGSFYCVYRSVDGHPICAISRDGGRSWSPPQYQSYADGRLMKHPRAANFAWKCANGKYLYWFHNHGGRFIREPQFGLNPYDDRNPVWLCGGTEADSPQGRIIRWSQPEIVLYDDDPYVRISYPDLVEEHGRFFLTETQKNVARVHEVDPDLLEGLWGQAENATVAERGLLLDLSAREGALPPTVPMPRLPQFTVRDVRRPDYGTLDMRAGFSVEIWARFGALDHPQLLVDNRTEEGQGFCLRAVDGTVELVLNDGRTENRWACDPGRIKPGALHHLVAVVDGGPKIITFVVDGQLCDGGEDRQFGWGRFSPHLRGANGGQTLRISPGFTGETLCVRLYGRYLRTSEAVGNYRAGV